MLNPPCEPKLYGIYKGIVTDREDPEKMGRLRIECPSVLDRNSTWALPAARLHKDFDLPRKNEPVWIIFQGGKPQLPVWLPGFSTAQGTPFAISSDQVESYPTNEGSDGIKLIKHNNLVIEIFSDSNSNQESDILIIRDINNQSYFKLDSKEGIEIKSEYPIKLETPQTMNLQSGKVENRVKGNKLEAVMGNWNQSVGNNINLTIGKIFNMIVTETMKIQGDETTDMYVESGLTDTTIRGFRTDESETRIKHPTQNHFEAPKNLLGENPDDNVLKGQVFIDLLKQILQLIKLHTHPTPAGIAGQSVELQSALLTTVGTEEQFNLTKSEINEVE